MNYVRERSRELTILAVIALAAYSGYGFACSQSQVSKVKREVNRGAAILNAAAKTNHQLYLAHTITLAQRQQAAKIIFEANELVAQAVELAAQLQPGMSGDTIIALLEQAAQTLAREHVGNPQLDTALQGAVAAINSAILLARSLR